MKVLLFSHESDIDGMGSVILSKLAFKDIDYVLAPNPKPMELIFRKYLEDNKLYDYDKIFVTDLSLENPSLDMVYKDDILNKKVQVFDHHEKAIKLGLNKYDFTFIEEVDDNGKKRCATEIFYKYLLDNNYLNSTNALDTFVEFTRLEDTWEWKKKGIPKAHDLSILFNEVGIDKYIELVLENLKEKEFKFTNLEIDLINKKKKEYEEILNKYIKEVEYLKDEDNNTFAILYADYEYRNEITEYIETHNTNNAKYVMIIALDKADYGQISYRSISDVDVNKIAMKHNGGGHPKAAASSITKEQRERLNNLSKKDGKNLLLKNI